MLYKLRLVELKHHASGVLMSKLFGSRGEVHSVKLRCCYFQYLCSLDYETAFFYTSFLNRRQSLNVITIPVTHCSLSSGTLPPLNLARTKTFLAESLQHSPAQTDDVTAFKMLKIFDDGRTDHGEISRRIIRAIMVRTDERTHARR